ncbi:MAG: protein phosphatase 2C domain-containing protein [Gemmatimonadota bacterium]
MSLPESGLTASTKTPMAPRMAGLGRTHIGLVRGRNEDAFRVGADGTYGIVADGMGGGPAGDVASRIAADAASTHLAQLRDPLTGRQGGAGSRAALLARAVGEAVREANAAVRRHVLAEPSFHGMGCTLTIAAVDPETSTFAVGHVGDSRAYRVSRDAWQRLTQDHTLAQESVDEGRLTREAARHHPFGHVLTRVIGIDPDVDPQVTLGRLEVGDTLLLCTDGLVRVVEEGDIVARAGSGAALATIADSLVDEAVAGGGPDNITLVLMRAEEDER